ncbi:MAG TPA: hypothetical protein VM689_13395 [Aliidongia sp.]|nr:hypothetical protein [Aliidongia sp.]
MTAGTFLARDDLGYVIQLLPYRPNGGWGVATGTKVVTVGPFQAGTRIVTLRAVVAPVFWQDGAVGVTVAAPTGNFAGSGPHYLAAGETVDVALGGAQGDEPLAVEIAVVSATGVAGNLYVSERG